VSLLLNSLIHHSRHRFCLAWIKLYYYKCTPPLENSQSQSGSLWHPSVLQILNPLSSLTKILFLPLFEKINVTIWPSQARNFSKDNPNMAVTSNGNSALDSPQPWVHETP
jgi:hypothetical protein